MNLNSFQPQLQRDNTNTDTDDLQISLLDSYLSPASSSSSTGEFAFSLPRRYVLHYLLIGSTCLTMLGASLVLLTYIIKRSKGKTKEDGAKMIFLLNLPGFFGSFFWFPFVSVNNKAFCLIQASGIQFFELSALCWSSCIVVTFLAVVSKKSTATEAPTTNFTLFHLISWGIPFCSLIPCLALHLYGPTQGPWCWIPNPGIRLIVYAPGALLVLFIVTSYIYLRFKLGKQDGYDFITKRFFYFIIASLLCQAPSLVNRIQNYIYPEDPIYVLYLLQSLFQPLQGFLNAMVYGIIDEYFWDVLRSCCCCRSSAPISSIINDSFIGVTDSTSLLIDYESNSQRYNSKFLINNELKRNSYGY